MSKKSQEKWIDFGTDTGKVADRSIPSIFSPDNYTPVAVAGEGADKVSAHLKGIDNAIGGTIAAVGKRYSAVFNGSETEKTVDTTADAIDPQKSVIQVVDFNNKNFNIKVFRTSVTEIKLEATVAPPAGTYTVIVLEARFAYSKYYDFTMNGSDLQKDIDVLLDDKVYSHKAIAQLLDADNDYLHINGSFGVDLHRISSRYVRVNTSTPLPSGNYRLVVVETGATEEGGIAGVTFNGSETTKTHDILLANKVNAQKSFIYLLDPSNDYTTLHEAVISRPTTSTVQIDTSEPLPAGTYYLLSQEVS